MAGILHSKSVLLTGLHSKSVFRASPFRGYCLTVDNHASHINTSSFQIVSQHSLSGSLQENQKMKCPLESRHISSVDIIETLLSIFTRHTADAVH
jgi:hypothetical protein